MSTDKKHIISVLGSSWILAGECRGAKPKATTTHPEICLESETAPSHDITCILVFVGEVGLADSTWIRH